MASVVKLTCILLLFEEFEQCLMEVVSSEGFVFKSLGWNAGGELRPKRQPQRNGMVAEMRVRPGRVGDQIHQFNRMSGERVGSQH